MTDPSHNLTGKPYGGPAGRTRIEQVRVFRPGTEPQEVEVFRVVNVEEYPELREPALAGALHHLDDGQVLEVPFVFHDPTARQFVLVIPDAARGRELHERAQLLELLMTDDDENVPPYVRHFDIVYGAEGLALYVEEGDRIEVDLRELEPVDGPPSVAHYYPALAGLLPEAGFSERLRTELATLVDNGELWIFLEVEDMEGEAFAESSSDLLLQLKTVDQLPVCVLTLLDRRAGAIRRAYLNPLRSADRPILELLYRDFHAIVVVRETKRGRHRCFRLEAPRAANAKMILERTDGAPSCSSDRWKSAVDACRATPPPIAPSDHPFFMQDEAETAADALARLRALEAWTSTERANEALLVRSIPRMAFELARRRVVLDAVRYGLAMSDALVLQAVSFGLAPDSKTLVESLCERFSKIVPTASEHGLDVAEIEANRGALGRLSGRYGASTGPEVSCTMEHSG